ncbi:MAG: nucleotidyltransferase domain-containing protein [Endomicrobiaceae bacterium]|nr:nucleotidyltransferase domain-containing protein [Endomicrobiaceae bacterium]
MINLEEKYLTEIKKILAKYLPENSKVYVFGSRITDKYKKYSDLDLAININNKQIDSEIILNLKLDFENSLIPIKVDIVDFNNITTEFRQIIQSNLVELDIAFV